MHSAQENEPGLWPKACALNPAPDSEPWHWGFFLGGSSFPQIPRGLSGILGLGFRILGVWAFAVLGVCGFGGLGGFGGVWGFGVLGFCEGLGIWFFLGVWGSEVWGVYGFRMILGSGFRDFSVEFRVLA